MNWKTRSKCESQTGKRRIMFEFLSQGSARISEFENQPRSWSVKVKVKQRGEMYEFLRLRSAELEN